MGADQGGYRAFAALPMAEEDNPSVARVQDPCLLGIELDRIASLVSEQAMIMHPADRIRLVDFPIQGRFKVI